MFVGHRHTWIIMSMYVCGKHAYRDTHAYVSSWETYIPQTGSPAKHTDLAFYLMLCLRGTLIPVLLRSVRSDNTYIHTYIHTCLFFSMYLSPDIHTYHTYLLFSRYVCFPAGHTYILGMYDSSMYPRNEHTRAFEVCTFGPCIHTYIPLLF